MIKAGFSSTNHKDRLRLLLIKKRSRAIVMIAWLLSVQTPHFQPKKHTIAKTLALYKIV